MPKLGFIALILLMTFLFSNKLAIANTQLNLAPNDDVIKGIKALHRNPEIEMTRLKTLLEENDAHPERHKWLYLYALGKEKRGEYDAALNLVEAGLRNINTEGLMRQRLKMLQAKIYANTGEVMTAIKLLNSVKKWSINNGVIQLNIGVLMTLGAVFESIQEHQLALDNYLVAYEMAIQFKTQISAPHIAGLIGTVYLELSRYEDARNYLLEAYDFSKKKNNALVQGRFAEKIALVEYELLDAESSEEYFDQAIEIAQRSKDTPLLARSLLGKGKMLLRQADKEKSIEVVRSYYETALLLASNLDNKTLYFDALLALSKLALSNGDIDVALLRLEEAEALLKGNKPGQQNLEAAHLRLSIMETSNNERAQINALKNFISLSETVSQSLDKSRVQVIRTLYELDEIQEENTNLKKVTRLQAEKLNLNKQRNYLFGALAGLLCLLSISLFLLYAKRIRYQRRLEKLATTDSLTRFFNRGKTLELLDAHINNLAQNGHDFCVAMLDIDFFKMINDKYGHKVGDDALRLFSKVAREHFTDNVLMGRLGGEEFLFIFDNISLKEALSSLDVFRCSLKETSQDKLSNEIKLTFSAGLMAISTSQSVTSVLENTDIALYQAKESGRGKTVIFNCL